jgi:acyl carrier protein
MSVEQDLLDWIARALGPGAGALTTETALISTGRLHSLQILELIEFAEGRFDVKVVQADLHSENFETVIAIARLVRRYQKAS